MDVKRPKPVTSCAVCVAPGYATSLVNLPCGRHIGREICLGVNRSAVGEHDWVECPGCKGTGGLPRCEHCDDGSGWIFVRDRP
jgi:hypothetical protein